MKKNVVVISAAIIALPSLAMSQVVTFDTASLTLAQSQAATYNATQKAGGVSGTPSLSRVTLTAGGGAAGSFFNVNSNLTNTLDLGTNYVGYTVASAANNAMYATNIRFTSQGSNSAPNNYAIAYSTDGFTTSQQTTFTGVTSTSAALRTFNITDLITNDTISVRMYNYGATSINGGTSSAGGSFRVISPDILGTSVTQDLSSVTLAALTEFRNSGAMSFGGTIAGSFGIQKTGAGVLTLGSLTNSYTGTTTVSAGTLKVTGRLPDASAVIVNAGTYEVASSDTVAAVTLNDGTISGTGTLTGSSYAVKKGSISAKLAGTGTLTKSTADTVTLSGANTYTGLTTVSAGTLSLATTGSITSDVDVNAGTFEVNGTATGDVLVLSGATLKGSGTIKGDVLVGGTLSPGNSPGLLKIDGSLSLSGATSNFEVEGTGTVRGADATNGYDAVDVTTLNSGTGALTYDGTLNVDFEAGAPANGSSFDFFNFASFGGAFSDINIAFAGLDKNANWTINLGVWTSTIDGSVFTFTNASGVLSISASAVPEPLTAAGVILLASRVLGRRSRVSL